MANAIDLGEVHALACKSLCLCEDTLTRGVNIDTTTGDPCCPLDCAQEPGCPSGLTSICR